MTANRRCGGVLPSIADELERDGRATDSTGTDPTLQQILMVPRHTRGRFAVACDLWVVVKRSLDAAFTA